MVQTTLGGSKPLHPNTTPPAPKVSPICEACKRVVHTLTKVKEQWVCDDCAAALSLNQGKREVLARLADGKPHLLDVNLLSSGMEGRGLIRNCGLAGDGYESHYQLTDKGRTVLNTLNTLAHDLPEVKPVAFKPMCSVNGCTQDAAWETATRFLCGVHYAELSAYPSIASQYTRIEQAAAEQHTDPQPPGPVPPSDAPDLSCYLCGRALQDADDIRRGSHLDCYNAIKLASSTRFPRPTPDQEKPALGTATELAFLRSELEIAVQRIAELEAQNALAKSDFLSLLMALSKLMDRRKTALKRAAKYRRDLSIVRARRDGWKKRCEGEIKVQVALRAELEALKAQQLAPIANIVDLPLVEKPAETPQPDEPTTQPAESPAVPATVAQEGGEVAHPKA